MHYKRYTPTYETVETLTYSLFTGYTQGGFQIFVEPFSKKFYKKIHLTEWLPSSYNKVKRALTHAYEGSRKYV
jgi:hypothetical protein